MDYLNSSDVEVAVEILTEAKTTMYYKDLILEVIKRRQKPEESVSEMISEIYTQINMDSRFHYEGSGKWGLTEWNPPEVKRSARGGARSTVGSRAKNNRQRKEMLLEGIQEDN